MKNGCETLGSQFSVENMISAGMVDEDFRYKVTLLLPPGLIKSQSIAVAFIVRFESRNASKPTV